jgi:ABC-type transport system involved in multi-copper enzyme maturation permease subunit
MVWVSVGLLAFMTFLVALLTQTGRWTMAHWRFPRRTGPTLQEYADQLHQMKQFFALDPSALAMHYAVVDSLQNVIDNSGFFVFSNWFVFRVFSTFLMPMWSLSFATDALGQDREAGNIIWLLTRPLSRASVYLAKFLAVLPWSVGLNLGGFCLLCLVAGEPGRLALQLYWPAVLWGTLAYCALFHLMGACFRRPAVIAILYTFFLETVAGNLPDYLKRASISFYVRCLMYDSAQDFGIGPERPEFFLPVSGDVAWVVLAGLTVFLLGIGMWVFSRNEYLDLS